MKFIDRTGQIFNHLKFIKVAEKRGRSIFWEVECLLCHTRKILYHGKIVAGFTKSCGCLQPSQRQDPKDYCIKRIFDIYRYAAKKRKILFALSLEQFKVYLFQPCYYCGDTNSNNYKADKDMPKHTLRYNGIDRLDNNIGYIIDNIVSCCKLCNRMKMMIPWEDFLIQIFKIVQNRSTDWLKL